MKHFLYILKSKSADKFYIGSSKNPHRRLEYHNSIEKGFTSRYRPWEIIFIKEYEFKEEAEKAERKIKSWKSSNMVERIISGETKL